ncbi:MAG: hypothetical protein ABSF80_01730 [Chitinispirillaceae bacterium]
MKIKNKGIKAWLVTWDYSGEHAKPKNKIVAIFNPHWSVDKVKQIIELLYVQLTFSLIEKGKYAKNKSFNPYPAKEYRGRITCGDNPMLYARLVSNFIAEDHTDESKTTWIEPNPIKE